MLTTAEVTLAVALSVAALVVVVVAFNSLCVRRSFGVCFTAKSKSVVSCSSRPRRGTPNQILNFPCWTGQCPSLGDRSPAPDYFCFPPRAGHRTGVERPCRPCEKEGLVQYTCSTVLLYMALSAVDSHHPLTDVPFVCCWGFFWSCRLLPPNRPSPARPAQRRARPRPPTPRER